jgi:hypothetical protein
LEKPTIELKGRQRKKRNSPEVRVGRIQHEVTLFDDYGRNAEHGRFTRSHPPVSDRASGGLLRRKCSSRNLKIGGDISAAKDISIRRLGCEMNEHFK